MKRTTLLCTAAAAAVVLAGCESPEGNPNRTGTGALIGGVIGATAGGLIGSTSHHDSSANAAAGALIGGAIGAITGGSIGHSLDQEAEARLRAQAPQTLVRVDQGQPLGVADVKALARAGVSEDVIISQIRSSRTVYRLTAAEIIELHEAGVSQKIIEYMINTPSMSGAAAPPAQTTVVVSEAPPPPPVETVIVAPGPGYVWIGGEWEWHGRWVWIGGPWVWPPYPHAVWMHGGWNHGPRGWHHAPGRWR
jgi:outer membrane lipoprotein SlyB